MFAEGFFLSRGLPQDAATKNLLETIARDAAFAGDLSIVRAAALFSEKIQI